MSLSGGILAGGSEAASGKDEWSLIVVLFGTILSSLHHTMSVERMDVILFDNRIVTGLVSAVSSVQRQTLQVVVAYLLELGDEGELVG